MKMKIETLINCIKNQERHCTVVGNGRYILMDSQDFYMNR